MDLEDLFNESEDQPFIPSSQQQEPMVIPEWGPCGEEEEEKQMSQNNCNQEGCQKQKGFGKKGKGKQEEEKDQPPQPDRNSNICYKCRSTPANFTNKSDKICKACFLDHITHRFKSSLRGNLKIWKDDLNLVCVSGGSNSMALLHLLYKSLFGNLSNRKMFFQVHVLYIDEGVAVYGWTEEQRKWNADQIKQICSDYGFTFTIVPLESVFAIESTKIDLKARSESEKHFLEEEKKQDEEQHSVPVLSSVANMELAVADLALLREKLRTLINSLSSVSNFREDLILYLKKWVIVDFALQHNFKKILLGTSGHKVATQLLGQLAKGRGVSVSHEISYIDDKNFGAQMTFMNPMREFLQKEIALYNHLNKVDVFMQKSLAQINNEKSNAPYFGSADYLIENFFNMLQDKYNVNTVPTVIRLTNKLLKTEVDQQSSINHQVSHVFCPLCLGIRDKVNNLLEIGSTIKQIKVEGGVNVPVSIASSDEWLVSEVEKSFCFGCKRMSISALEREKFIELLPPIVHQNAARSLAEIN